MDAKDILYGQNWVEQMRFAFAMQTFVTMENAVDCYGMNATWLPFSWEDTEQGFMVWQDRDGHYAGSIKNILTR